MAVEITGSYTTYSTSTQDDSFNITVPADASAIFVVVGGYVGDGLVDGLNFDNGGTLDFTLVAAETYSGTDEYVEVYSMVDSDANFPSSGVQTLYCNAVGEIDQGFWYGVFYVSGSDSNDLIGDLDSDQMSTTTSPWDSATLSGVGTDDLTLIVVGEYYNSEGSPSQVTVDPSGYGQAVLFQTTAYDKNIISVGYEQGEDSIRVEGNNGLFAPIVFAVNAAAAAAAPVLMPQSRYLQNFLAR